MNFKTTLTSAMLHKWAILAVVQTALLFGQDGRAGTIELAEFNRRATATAQLLAGITPNPPEPAFNRLLELDA